MSPEELQQAIQTQYPTIWGLINKPGVYDILVQAIENNWPASRTQAALEQTPYFQSTPLPLRQWDALQATDPATAQQTWDSMSQRIVDEASKMGIALNPDTLGPLIPQAISGAWDTATIRAHVITLANSGTTRSTGQIAGNEAQIKAQAAAYGVPLSDATISDFANQMTLGTMDAQGMNAYLIEQAKSLYPSLGAPGGALDSGITVAQYTDPYKQIAQQELGINPSDFNLSDPKWAKALQQVDPKTGARTAMSLSDWQSTLRTDPSYGFDTTTNGRDQAAQLTTTLAKMFGAQG